ACATLGVPIDKVRLSDREVVIPRPDGRDIVLPVRTYQSPRLERRVGMLMDIPWFGGGDWETMYDWPAHSARTQHMAALKVWDMVRDRKIAIHNNQTADKALKGMVKIFGIDAPKAHLAAPPDVNRIDSRLKVIRKSIEE